jgi:hypothetical protein
MSPPGASTVRARQIAVSDISAVADLLASGFRDRPHDFWLQVFARLTEHSPPAGLPKYGYMLESDGAAVGAILLIFSTTLRNGAADTVRCNVSSWYVAPAFRSYASMFVSKALGHRGVTYLNITPAPHTVPLVRAQGYAQYSKGVFVAVPALQRRSSGASVIAADARPPEDGEAFEHALLLEHARYGCISLWCTAEGRAHPFVFRPRTFRGFVPCAQLVYCRDIDDFVRFAGPIGRFLMARGRPVAMIDSNGPIAGLVGKYFADKMPKYFRGPDQPRLGDLAYTETAMFGV